MKISIPRIFLLICLVLVVDFVQPELLMADNSDAKSANSGQDAARKRRRPGAKASLFDEMEIFKHNCDIFVGPAIHSGSGEYLSSLEEGLKLPQPLFRSDGSVDASFFTVMGGMQYRLIPAYKDKGILSMLSYAGGFNIQRRGYSYQLEKQRIDANAFDNLIITENVRATYLNVPLSVRFGRRIFVEAGLSLDFMIMGKSDLSMERSLATSENAPENSGIVEFLAEQKRVGKLGNILPFMSPGFTVSSGLYFTENVGFRVCGNFNNAFFKADTNPDNFNFGSSLFSIQLLGCIN
jgi:hypothetical protein